MARVFLAGATGVLGRRLVPLLLAHGHQVTGLARSSASADWIRSLGAETVTGDGTFYGPDTWYSPTGLMAQSAAQLPANGDVTSFVHIDDAASAALQSLDWGNGPVNACDDEPAAGSEWVPEFCALVGAEAPAGSSQRTPFTRGADNSYARRSLGWQPAWPSWRDGFKALTGRTTG